MMEIKNAAIDSFLKSIAFSALLSLFCAVFAVIHARALLLSFDFFELLHLAYNVTVALFFLVRVRPSVVSMNLIHWTVALITSFSGFFFIKNGLNPHPSLIRAGDTLIGTAVLFGLVAAVVLGRSFDIFPALRRVQTKYVYQIVRHPIYLSAIVIRVGYCLKNPSVYNVLVLLVVVILYDRRAMYEEDIMSHDRSYVDYLGQVRYRFIPGLY